MNVLAKKTRHLLNLGDEQHSGLTADGYTETAQTLTPRTINVSGTWRF